MRVKVISVYCKNRAHTGKKTIVALTSIFLINIKIPLVLSQNEGDCVI